MIHHHVILSTQLKFQKKNNFAITKFLHFIFTYVKDLWGLHLFKKPEIELRIIILSTSNIYAYANKLRKMKPHPPHQEGISNKCIFFCLIIIYKNL